MNSLDLHGIRHEFVIRELDNFFWKMMQKKSGSVEIITGISDKMKGIVIDTCSDYNFRVSDHPTNIGCLIVIID